MPTDPPELPLPMPLRLWRGLRDPLGLLTSAAELGDVVALRRTRSYAVFHPRHVRHVLQDNAQNYEKGEKYRNALAPIMGNGLFVSEGAFWLRQRRLAQVAFQRAQLQSFCDPIRECAQDLTADWTAKSDRAEPIALREDLIRATIRITVRCLFGVDPEMQTLVPAIVAIGEDINLAKQFLPVRLPPWVPTPARRRFAGGIGVVNRFVTDIVETRGRAVQPGEDLLGLLMRGDAGDPRIGMTPEQLRDELVTMLFAGHDTVTDATVWTLVLLTRHPAIKRRVQEEVRRVAERDGFNHDSIQRLDLLGRVIHEALRLYPPGWCFARTAIADDEIGGYRIPAGALVAISPYVLHRAPQFWERPEAFDPDRFLPDRSARRDRFAYFPFGAGQRQCIGAGLAFLELPIILATILATLDVEVTEPERIVPSPRISLRPRGAVWIKVAKRA